MMKIQLHQLSQGWWLTTSVDAVGQTVHAAVDHAADASTPLSGARQAVSVKGPKGLVAAFGLEALADAWHIMEFVPAAQGWRVRAVRYCAPPVVAQGPTSNVTLPLIPLTVLLRTALKFSPTPGVHVTLDAGQRISVRVPAHYGLSPYLRGLSEWGGSVECFHPSLALGKIRASALLEAIRLGICGDAPAGMPLSAFVLFEEGVNIPLDAGQTQCTRCGRTFELDFREDGTQLRVCEHCGGDAAQASTFGAMAAMPQV